MGRIFLTKLLYLNSKMCWKIGKVDDAKSSLVLYTAILYYHSTYIRLHVPLELHHHGPNAPRAPGRKDGGVMAIPKDPLKGSLEYRMKLYMKLPLCILCFKTYECVCVFLTCHTHTKPQLVPRSWE